MSTVRRFAVVLSVALVVSVMLPLLSFASVPAAVDVNIGFDMWDFLWDLMDGIGGFCRDIINYVGQFIQTLISAIRNGVNAVIDAISKIIKAIGNGISYILSGLKYLFIPSKESFVKFRDDILTSFDKKFGSVFSALTYLGDRFKGLGAKKDLGTIFQVAFPESSFLSGLSIDFLAFAAPVLGFIRFCVTGFCCVITALIGYNKVISMANT